MKNLGFDVMHVYGLTETYGHMLQCAWNDEWDNLEQDKLNEIREIGSRIEESVSAYFESINKPDPTYNFQWEYILIDNDKIKNAWCMPGGKIAVYTGILEITKNKHNLREKII